jgi:hypothetical protein
MAAFVFSPDSDEAWVEECGENGDGCERCGGKHDSTECPVFEDRESDSIARLERLVRSAESEYDRVHGDR